MSSQTLPMPLTPTLTQKLLAELLGTCALLCAVIGSGIMAERLCGGNTGLGNGRVGERESLRIERGGKHWRASGYVCGAGCLSCQRQV